MLLHVLRVEAAAGGAGEVQARDAGRIVGAARRAPPHHAGTENGIQGVDRRQPRLPSAGGCRLGAALEQAAAAGRGGSRGPIGTDTPTLGWHAGQLPMQGRFQHRMLSKQRSKRVNRPHLREPVHEAKVRQPRRGASLAQADQPQRRAGRQRVALPARFGGAELLPKKR